MSNTTAGSQGAAVTDVLEFTLNGEAVRVAGVAPTTTLLDWLRHTGRVGTKCGCAEGDCGACTVAVVDQTAAGKPTYRAINSCIALLPMFAGREVVTVEGLARDGQLHPVQSALVEHGGSQCGYCTPGFVMSMFEAYHRREVTQPCQINDQLCGNLCRCTGYRPIRDAMAAVVRQRDAQTPSSQGDPLAKRLEWMVPDARALNYLSGGERFFRPTSLPELFALKKKFADAVLVAGATEIGVELNKKFKRFPALISTEGVPELTRITSTPVDWRIGAAATLTAIEEALAGEYPSLAKMLAVFASRQIRNRATLGGNLVTASPIGDSAPVLMTLDASVVLASTLGERTLPLHEFFTGYRQTQLRPDEVMKEIVLPHAWAASDLTRRADFQKISHRRELDISIVAGAFCVDVDADGIVRRARIAYGGVAAQPVRARKAEAALEGRSLAEARDSVAEILRSEFKPIDDVRGSAAYRRGVVVGAWDKFVAGETSLAVDAPPSFTGGAAWTAPDPSKQLRHESAVGHVTGRAHYVDDTAQQRPMLDVWPVLAPHARARILRRDVTAARAAPGVAAVLVAEDIPGENNVGVARHDESLLAADEVLFHGHIVALVVGESVAACRAAAALVEVEYEPLPAVLTIADAVARDSFHNPLRVITRGEPAAAVAAAPRRLQGEFAFGGQEHFYLETHAAWAECGDEGDVFISSSTQHPSEIQAIVAEVLHLPRNKIVVQAPRMGGGFGGKETQGNTPAALVALAAVKTGRPVRVQWDRDVDMTLTGKRHPFHSVFEVGFDADGRIQGAVIDLISDGGWSLDLSQPVLERAMFHVDNAYYLPALRVTGRAAKTNVASNTAFRGFGGPQGLLVIEEIMARIARTLGLAPEVVRERNFYHGTGETNRTHYGEDVGDHRLQTIWHAVKTQARFEERRQEVERWNQTHARVKRGLAITPVKFGISFTLTHYNQGGALVHIYQDGTVQVNHGGTEMGQGLHTKILGVAMRELGLPAASIRMMRTSTDKVPNTSATAASAGADLNGAAVRVACVTLRERMAPIAARVLTAAAEGSLRSDLGVDIANPLRGTKTLPPVDVAEVIFGDGCVWSSARPDLRLPFAKVAVQCYVERVSLSSTGFYATPGIHWDWAKALGRPFAYYACGAAVSEVEVDGYTGMSRVVRVDVVHDVGDSLNPGVDRGQIEGGFVQGMGWLTSEELKWDAKGRLLTHSASTYQIPAISDAPMEFNVTLLPHATNTHAVHGSKAVGEPPLMLAISVREAIRDAVGNFGPAGGEVTLASPATGEAVFAAIARRG
ncbi:xanthine dehydrogenase small subunit [Horticoccus sp. 23ND18S-11]|uniref:xanthine dehydrogenase small subunit n=1 Tax=Horticoccus sp. 23ND18S-11 TaxID=3391832 RepID=UPI0039C9BAE0